MILGECPPNSLDNLGHDEESLTLSANLPWDVTSDVMAYATTSTGFKAGGFNSFYIQNDPESADFKEEEVMSVEVGTKMSLLNGAAELNVALFRSDYDDLQASVFRGHASLNV